MYIYLEIYIYYVASFNWEIKIRMALFLVQKSTEISTILCYNPILGALRGQQKIRQEDALIAVAALKKLCETRKLEVEQMIQQRVNPTPVIKNGRTVISQRL
jgi:hypothetical protein